MEPFSAFIATVLVISVLGGAIFSQFLQSDDPGKKKVAQWAVDVSSAGGMGVLSVGLVLGLSHVLFGVPELTTPIRLVGLAAFAVGSACTLWYVRSQRS